MAGGLGATAGRSLGAVRFRVLQLCREWCTDAMEGLNIRPAAINRRDAARPGLDTCVRHTQSSMSCNRTDGHFLRTTWRPPTRARIPMPPSVRSVFQFARPHHATMCHARATSDQEPSTAPTQHPRGAPASPSIPSARRRHHQPPSRPLQSDPASGARLPHPSAAACCERIPPPPTLYHRKSPPTAPPPPTLLRRRLFPLLY